MQARALVSVHRMGQAEELPGLSVVALLGK
jgi:hypothetical protein